jgi:hypothetical protein
MLPQESFAKSFAEYTVVTKRQKSALGSKQAAVRALGILHCRTV